MTRYIETFFRHKLLLCTPLVLTLLVSVWYVSKQPTTYTTTTTVWFDNQLPGPSSLDGGPASYPSSTAQTLLTQLLSTKEFRAKAANRGPLVDYIRSHGGGSVEDQVASKLASATAFPVGPQVLSIGMTDRDPNLAPIELTAVVDQYFESVKDLRSAREQASVDYYQPRLDAATATLQKAQAAQIAYLQAHPESANVGSSDPTYGALSTAVANAQTRYADVQNAYTQANQALTTEQASVSSHVIDAPGAAVASSKKKAAIFAGGAGLFFGLLLGLLGLIALTAADTAARQREDVEMSPGGLQVVATITEFRRDRSTQREVGS